MNKRIYTPTFEGAKIIKLDYTSKPPKGAFKITAQDQDFPDRNV